MRHTRKRTGNELFFKLKMGNTSFIKWIYFCLCACVYLYVLFMCTWHMNAVPMKARREHRSSGTGVAGNSEPPMKAQK